ncbi:SET domain-containing protein [Aspergillus mulundensis]|uniref:SET domain-containing protein n=1 Tax=Aspergillus mulundensis TaxID=1810919 RepID=A0A3D8RYI3_9EURO|nr:hypothetical protein DSM5745_05947 [Aspergillus mulundensis]RDW79095.1 hypothetical protein DSM5745_05947 [Aspergillus mulundensis]
MLPWIHPHLAQSVNPNKGRQLQAAQPIQRGEVLLIDPPYAIIPISDVDAATSSGNIICNNPQCNTTVPQEKGTHCPKRCNKDVIWCNKDCRDTDKARHNFECTWLAKYTASLRSKWGYYNFGMLWLIVRALARRCTESSQSHDTATADYNDQESQQSHLSLSRFKSGWAAIDALCGTTETWSHAQVREWTVLVKKYLSSSALPHNLPNTDVLALICKEEANSFGLYPRETGVFPPPDPTANRGEQFGAAVYPRASIANHSCCPNIIHKPDEQGRMVFTAGRDIAAGEECCISYFDLTQYVGLQERRGRLQSLFRFKCGCARCVEEEAEQEATGEDGNEVGWDAFPDFG